jgi:UDP:flavonoid glycosyltransferase YjiC (YdhE family)
MKNIIFAPATYNLAETTRMLEIARACKDKFKPHFIAYGGQFEALIEKAGFIVHKLEPRLTPEKIDHIYKVDKGEKLGTFFTNEEIRARLHSELKVFKEVNPAVTLTGFCLTIPYSTRIHGSPLVWVVQSTWLKETGMGMIPQNALGVFRPLVISILGELTNIGVKLILLNPMNRIAREFGAPPIKGYFEYFSGDETLMAEPPGFSDLPEPPPHHHYIGPLIAREDFPIPQEVLNIPHDKPIVYFAMGSSGTAEIIAKLLKGFEGQPYTVISPVKKLMEKINIKVPDNVILTDWLPAHKVNAMADITLIHGGIGTVMTAALAGKPVVGIGMQYEQDANLQCLVRKGFAIRIPKRKASAERALEAIETLLHDEEAKQKAKAFSEEVTHWDGPNRAAAFLVEHFS